MNFNKFINNPKPYYSELKRVISNYCFRILQRGDKVNCEICDWNGKLFFKNKCPKCNSLARTRLIPFSLKHFNLKKENLNILHIAPNANEYNYMKKNFNKIIKYDCLNIVKGKNINLICDLTKTNTIIKSGSYDLIIIWHVFEHIKEDDKAITEIFRLLKNGGNLLVSVPIYPKGNKFTIEVKKLDYKDYEKVHGHYDHCRSCGLDYYERFENSGFTTNFLYVNNIPTNKIARYGLSDSHVVWNFYKK